MSASAPPLIPQFPPVWAEVFGEDEAGVFAEFTVGGVVFVFRWIPPGRFLMGSTAVEAGRWDSEGPQHEVTITRGYWLGETPVTQAQWRAVTGVDPSRFKGDQRPVEQVSWHDSRAFVAKLNDLVPGLCAALPTEAQWEHACRAGTTSAFHDGSPCTKPEGKDPALLKLGWFDENSKNETHPVKEKLANAWGLHDMHGNVWEWCADAWDEKAYSRRDAGVSDPVTTSDKEDAGRVVRGGSWDFHARDCRSACRFALVPGARWDRRGLRLAAGQEPVPAEPSGAERPSPERRSRG